MCFHFSNDIKGIYLEVEPLGHIATFCLTFEETNCSPHWLQDFMFSPVMYKGSNFFNTCFIIGFDYSHPNGWAVWSHCGFDLLFLNDQWCWTSSHALTILAICLSSLEKCRFKFFAIFKSGCLSLCYWVERVLYIFWMLSSDLIHDLKIFFPFYRLPFYFMNNVFWGTKVFNFDQVQFIYIGFLLLVLLVSNPKMSLPR